MSEPGLPRPRQVTVAAGIGLFGCLVLIVGLFDSMAKTRTVDARNSVADFLSSPPGDGLGLSVSDVLQVWRVVLLVAGALAAAAFVMGIFVIQRHNGARIGFTVAAGLLLLAMPAVGVMPVVLAVAATGLWSAPSRDWFAGRAPRPKPERPPQAPRVTVEAPTAEAPPPSAYPFGTAPPEQQAGAPTQPVQGPTAAGPAYAPVQEPIGYPPAQQALAYPPPVISAWPPPVAPHPTAVTRPTTVLWAAILTWVAAGFTAVCLGLGVVVLATSQSEFQARLQEQLDSDAQLRSLGMTAEELMPFVWAVCVGSIVWSLIAMVLAYLAFRRVGWARIVLAISASGAAVVSLLGILGILPVFTLAPSVATVVLLFSRSTNAWYAGRSEGPAPLSSRDRPW